MVAFFYTDLAEQFGLVPAILLQHIYGWIRHNEANEKNYHDGRYWTFNSRKAFADLFPFITERTAFNAIKKLCDEGVLLTGNYNTTPYDRTMWYALTDLGLSIMQKREMHDENISESITNEIPNRNIEKEKSNQKNVTDNTNIYTNIETNINTNTNPPISPQGDEQAPKRERKNRDGLTKEQQGMFDSFWSFYPRRQAKQAAIKAWCKLSPDADTLKAICKALAKQARSEDWTKENGKYIPLPASYLNGRRWEDEITPPPSQPVPQGTAATQPDAAARREAMIRQLEAASDKAMEELLAKVRGG